MEQIIDNQKPIRKIYKDRAIWSGTMLGGPLVAGYLIAENFKTLNESEKVKTTWIISILSTVIIFGGVFLIPESVKIPHQAIPLFYTAIAYLFVSYFQDQKIKQYINSGGQFYSWYRTIAVSIIGLIITVVPIASFLFYMME
jgi:hypothetical protein